MRADFKKLLCECYKENRAYATQNRAIRAKLRQHTRDEDDIGNGTVSMRYLRRDRKFFGENLAPLKRFLAKQVGRPWDKVYSEIRSVCAPQSAVGLHIYQHMYDFIHVQVVREEGQLLRHTSWGRLWPIEHDDLYVDPNDGIIKRARKTAAPSWRQRRRERLERQAEQAQLRRAIDATHSLEQLSGIWFEITWAPLPAAEELSRAKVRDVRSGQRIYPKRGFHDRQFPGLYPAHKQQLSKRQLKHYGLTNGG